MSVLVDSSVWIDYFRSGRGANKLEILIEEDLIVVNDLILAELIPALHLRRQRKLIDLMRQIFCPPLETDWDELIGMQVTCLRHGINKVGIPDLMIAQHARQNGYALYSRDKHFKLMADHLSLSLH
jgi:predicted nucleic acid-binding protein